ncbi:MAG: hypothetical protein WEE66_05040 [Actinomycetota bacterium]
MSTHEAVIEVRGLTKRYRGLTGRGGSDHSIYLGIHAARPERLKTILRQPVDS